MFRKAKKVEPKKPSLNIQMTFPFAMVTCLENTSHVKLRDVAPVDMTIERTRSESYTHTNNPVIDAIHHTIIADYGILHNAKAKIDKKINHIKTTHEL